MCLFFNFTSSCCSGSLQSPQLLCSIPKLNIDFLIKGQLELHFRPVILMFREISFPFRFTKTFLVQIQNLIGSASMFCSQLFKVIIVSFFHRGWIFFPFSFAFHVEEGWWSKIVLIIFHLHLDLNAYLLKEPVVCESVAMKEHIQVETGFLYDVHLASCPHGKQILTEFSTELWGLETQILQDREFFCNQCVLAYLCLQLYEECEYLSS